MKSDCRYLFPESWNLWTRPKIKKIGADGGNFSEVTRLRKEISTIWLHILLLTNESWICLILVSKCQTINQTFFLDERNLRKHLERKFSCSRETSTKNKICIFCNKIILSKNMSRHVKTFHCKYKPSEQIFCPILIFAFNFFANFLYHYKILNNMVSFWHWSNFVL